ncbi:MULTISPECIES: hypothetical protein [Frankia]|uniref:Uncharacterized protein n=1 Tax=Frankia casuarinae (strain DSM 45818 / CECT 9043 / HFP020203 / CcI3) TaxID=106370 RepID=Q2JCB0_FRACC|nr:MULTISPECIES: hypothetical protein [Frankia]ABD11082.1 hypothetical protein Francci3_1706 [Frankia casuarinae]
MWHTADQTRQEGGNVMDPERHLRETLVPHPEAVRAATVQANKPLYSVALAHNKNPSFWTTDVRVEAFPRLFDDRNLALDVIERAANIARELNPEVPVQTALFVHHDDGSGWAAFVD